MQQPIRFIASYILLLCLIFGGSRTAFAQTFTDSNLPIVLIKTDTGSNGQPLAIVDASRVLASMKVLKRPDGSRNYLADSSNATYLNYQGRINIEIRGSTSQNLPKKPYGLTTLLPDNVTSNNVTLLGMPAENDWILNSLAYDPSLMRDYISYKLSRDFLMTSYMHQCTNHYR